MEAENLAFLPVVDDDMIPTLTVGTLASIDTSQSNTTGDRIWVLGVKGRYVFARTQHPSDDMILLKGDKTGLPIQIFKGDELAALNLLGRVVWIVHQPKLRRRVRLINTADLGANDARDLGAIIRAKRQRQTHVDHARQNAVAFGH